MFTVKLLSTIGLLRPVRRHAFCPACKGWLGGDDAGRAVSPREIAPPALAAGVVLVAAAVAWIVVIDQSRSMGDMAMGLGSPGSFAAGWLMMMAAMMLPTALPLVFEFARHSERRAGWQVATGLLMRHLSRRLACLRRRGLPRVRRAPHAVGRSAPDRRRFVGARRHLCGHAVQALERGALSRAVRTPRPAAVQPAAQRRAGRSAVRRQLHRLQRGADGRHRC